MSSLTHGTFMEDMSSGLRSVVLLGPKPRPPIGGPYHPNARQRQAAEAGARRLRVQRLLHIHESRKAVLQVERELQASRASLLALEAEAGAEAVHTLDMFKSPAVPAMLRRKRRLRDALDGAEVPAATCGSCQDQAVKRNRLEVPDDLHDLLAAERRRLEVQQNDVNVKRHRSSEVYDDVSVKRHRSSEVHDEVCCSKRHHSEALDDARHVRRRLDDSVGVTLRHKLQEEDLNRRVEVFRDEARRSRCCASTQDTEESRHRAELRQADRWQRGEVAQDAALYRKRVHTVEEDAQHRQLAEQHKRQRVDVGEVAQRHRADAAGRAEMHRRYELVTRELRALQEQRAEAADLKIQVTASSASPPVPKKLVLVDDDVSPMMTAWCSKPGYEPTTPTDCIPSPLFMRGPRGIPGATPDPVCRSPSALCRSPCAR